MDSRDIILLILSVVVVGMLIYNVGGSFLNKDRAKYFELGVNSTLNQINKQLQYNAVNCIPIQIPINENKTLNLYDPEYCLGG